MIRTFPEQTLARCTRFEERALNAVVVTDPGRPPRWAAFRDPAAEEGEVLINVTAAALSPLVRAQASGAHYGRTETSSFVAGVDGVGLLDDGRRVYFAFPRSPFGSMAERAPVPAQRW